MRSSWLKVVSLWSPSIVNRYDEAAEAAGAAGAAEAVPLTPPASPAAVRPAAAARRRQRRLRTGVVGVVWLGVVVMAPTLNRCGARHIGQTLTCVAGRSKEAALKRG